MAETPTAPKTIKTGKGALEVTEGIQVMICPRCNHGIHPLESHEEADGVRTHRLSVCFDFVKGDLTEVAPKHETDAQKLKAETAKAAKTPAAAHVEPAASESKAYGLDEDEEDKKSDDKAKKK